MSSSPLLTRYIVPLFSTCLKAFDNDVGLLIFLPFEVRLPFELVYIYFDVSVGVLLLVMVLSAGSWDKLFF